MTRTRSWVLISALLGASCVEAPQTVHVEEPVTRTETGDRSAQQTLCGGHEEAPALVSLRWIRDGAERTGALQLEISSALEDRARMLLSIQAGARREIRYEDFELSPGELRTLTIALPRNLQGRKFSTQLRAIGRTFVGGQLIANFSAKPLYTHHEPSETHPRVYDRQTLKAQHRGGDLQRIALTGVPEAEIGGASMAYEIQDQTREDQP